MGAFDAIVGTTTKENEQETVIKTSTPKRSHQASSFTNLSSGVQKILSHVPDQEISKNFSSEESLGTRRFGTNRSVFRSLRSPERTLPKHSSDHLGLFSSKYVHKILSNLPDNELVISASNLNEKKKNTRNHSFLFKSASHLKRSSSELVNTDRQCLYGENREYCSVNSALCERLSENCSEHGENSDSYTQKPLGSYLHSSQGIASRMPVGRKNMGKYLQVPSESSVGTSSTASSEVSRPVSLTSLGSCSSSGSSGPHPHESTYLASVESLDSVNEHGGSADSGIAEQPMAITPEQRVLQEVLDTEAVYVADLNEVIQGYLEPWRADPDCLLATHLQFLFSNIEEIHEFNRKFLEDLRRAHCNPTKIANVFIQNDSGFSVYNEYCTNYPRTMDILGQLQRDEKMVPLFKEQQLALRHALPLGSYLLKPVQRILKYHLLLQRLSKQCEVEHKPAVDLALTTMTSVATNINNMKRKHEDAVRVQEIQSQLYGWTGSDLTALGELIAEGTFNVIGARAKRHIFLFEKVFLMAKRKENRILVYKSHIMCSNLMLVEHVRGEPLCFHVIPFDNPKLQSTLRARSIQHKREWTLQIKRVILENFDAKIPNHAKKLVMELGQDNVSENTNDKWSTHKQYSTPDYLERRSRVRKSRNLRRASSQDRSFTSLSNWRRKSEPEMIAQYNSKTMPKKISQLKKAKETGNATFYTDLSDSETCEVDESIENLAQIYSESSQDISQDTSLEDAEKMEKNLEKIVSELVQQNHPEFNKIWNRQRRILNSDPNPAVWNEERAKLPSKSDSLPRSFQLNDQIEDETDQGVAECKNDRLILDQSLKENANSSIEEHHDQSDLSSQMDESDYPEHKIYRKSSIRLSVVQRIKSQFFEDQKHKNRPQIYKQGSKRMGEKIANPDYEDPQKLFQNSRNSSQVSLTSDNTDIMGVREELDMTINENDVLKECYKRLQENNLSDTGQIENMKINENVVSSQNSESYYESILEKSLVEEYVKDSNGKLVAKSDSFSNPDSKFIYLQKYMNKLENGSTKSDGFERKTILKRPTKAPPPIPVKPTIFKLTNGTIVSNGSTVSNASTISNGKTLSSVNISHSVKNTSNGISKLSMNKSESISETIISSNNKIIHNQNESTSSTSWVKTVVNRFE